VYKRTVGCVIRAAQCKLKSGGIGKIGQVLQRLKAFQKGWENVTILVYDRAFWRMLTYEQAGDIFEILFSQKL
jgi:hypothetical protein